MSRVGLDPVKTTLLGYGQSYKDSYSLQNYISRFKTITHMSKRQLNGHGLNYTCNIDCGPHGSCRCGVCVGGGNSLNCDLPNCTECTASHYNMAMFLYYFTIIYIVCMIYLALCIYKKHTRNWMLRKVIFSPRWFECTHFTLVLLVGFVIIFSLVKVGLSDMIALALDRIPEEMYPSDHLMVVSEIKVTYH